MLEEAFEKTVKDRLIVATDLAEVAILHFGPQSESSYAIIERFLGP